MALVGLGSSGGDSPSGGAQQRGVRHRLPHGRVPRRDGVSLLCWMRNILEVLLPTAPAIAAGEAECAVGDAQVLSSQGSGCVWPGVGPAHRALYHVPRRPPEGDLRD